MSDSTRILIAGGGVGGLALAQALRQGGLDVTVHEQDPTPQIRNQGYRLHIDANGNAALRTCLPAETLDLVRRTSGVNGDLVAAYTHQLQEVMTATGSPAPAGCGWTSPRAVTTRVTCSSARRVSVRLYAASSSHTRP